MILVSSSHPLIRDIKPKSLVEHVFESKFSTSRVPVINYFINTFMGDVYLTFANLVFCPETYHMGESKISPTAR